MIPMKRGNYQVYKFVDEAGRELNKFFLPDSTFKRRLERSLEVSSLLNDGYSIIAVAYVDKETYLNLRISDTISEYCREDNLEFEYRNQYKRGDIDRDLYIDTMKSIQDYKWTLLKKLDMQMRRLFKEGFDCHDELAMQLYDQFLRAVM